jgi:hypothetical protein
MENLSNASQLKSQPAILNRKLAWMILLIVIVVSLAVVMVPAMLIMPFKPQTPRAVEMSYLLKSWSPIVTALGLIASLALAVWLWIGKRSWWRRSLLVLSMIPLLAAAWFARQNHFEWMFNPLKQTDFVKVSEAGFVGDKDMVMAVTINGESAAYPVRQMGYHHVVHDTVGGVPIVATY